MKIPPKLRVGDMVRVVAPSHSLQSITPDIRAEADRKMHEMGLRVTFSRHAEEQDEFGSSSIEARVQDLHQAFADPEVKAVLAVIGGFNCNQLLRYLDWELIENNPKILCGYSDITALNNAIFAKTGLVTYAGPHYSTFGQKKFFEYTLHNFQQCLMTSAPFAVAPSPTWSDDEWYQDQEKREPIPNEGWMIINEGQAEGTIIGSNLCTFNLLQGTEFFPSFRDTVLFLEDDAESQPHTFDRDLQSLLHLPGFEGVRGLVIGRFQKASAMTPSKLRRIIETKRELQSIPVVADIDFGHTSPMITIPIGGTAALRADAQSPSIEIVAH